jgi:MYXO-CTERM domain-containing protein
VLTRLHARHDKDSLGEDLVFEEAPAIAGGRGTPHDRGKLDPAVTEQPGGYNAFQARYAILHFWEGAVQCEDPLWDSWGGPPAGAGSQQPAVARDLAFVARGAELATYLSSDAPPAVAERGPGWCGTVDESKWGPKGCKCSVDPRDGGGPLAGLFGLGLFGLLTRRPQH